MRYRPNSQKIFSLPFIHERVRVIRILIMLLMMTSQRDRNYAAEPIGGAGLGLKATNDGRILVERVAPEGPAAKAGLQIGDFLVRVDDRNVRDLDGSQLVDAIRGPIGSKVVLAYVRGNSEVRSATVIRASLNPSPPPPPLAAAEERPKASTSDPAGGKGNSKSPLQSATGTLKFTQQTIRDPAANNVIAVTFLLPQGWQYQGQIIWLHQFSVLANLQLRMSSPDSTTVIEWLPTQHFSYTDQLPGLIQLGANWMGAILAPPIYEPGQFVAAFWAPQSLPHLQGLQPVAREEFPAIAREAVARDTGWRAQAFRLRYEFARAGQPWEQDVYFTLAYAPVNAGIAMWNVQRAFSCAAPKGSLAAVSALTKAVIANTSYTGEWLATYGVVQQLRRQGLQQQIADTAAFGRRLQDYNTHIRQLGQQMHEERMKSFDRIAESQREYLGGVETYTDPYLHQGLYVPAGYREHWVNQKGEIILSEQVGYNPNVGDVNDWRKMERRDPLKR